MMQTVVGCSRLLEQFNVTSECVNQMTHLIWTEYPLVTTVPTQTAMLTLVVLILIVFMHLREPATFAIHVLLWLDVDFFGLLVAGNSAKGRPRR
jgi:hypothetical protein